MATINLAVTVELNDDLTAEEIAELASGLNFAISRSAVEEVRSTVRMGHVGMVATVNCKLVEDEALAAK